MKKFQITVERVSGHCTCGYKVGDTFYAEGLNTPDKPFCGGAYIILFPMQTALASGSRFSFEKNDMCKTKLACPDDGKVTFYIELMNLEK